MNVLFISGLCASAAFALFCAVFAVFRGSLSNRAKYYLLLIPLALAILPQINLGINFTPKTDITQAANIIQTTIPSGGNTSDDMQQPVLNHTYAYPAARPQIPVKKLIFYGWLFGIAALTLLRTVEMIKLHRALTQIALKPSAEIQKIFDEMNTCPRAGLQCYSGAGTPFITGIFRPRVFLPEKGISAEDIPLALSHELVHVKRRDLLVKLAAEAVCILHFYNPLIWLLRGAIDRYCELSCDEQATRELSDAERKRYGMMLLSLMKQSRTPRSCACLCEGERNIRKRLTAIMSVRKSTRAGLFVAAALVLCAVIISGCAFSLTQEPSAPKEQPTGEQPTSDESAASGYRVMITDYMEQEMYRVFSPYYEVLSLEISNYVETETENGAEATFFCTLTAKNYDRDPDTVQYIIDARERGARYYEQLKAEYLAPQEMNFEFKAVVEGENITLYTNIDPKGIQWGECKVDDFIIPEREPISSVSKITFSNPERTVREFFDLFSEREYEAMTAYCTDSFIESAFHFTDAENKDFAAIRLINRAALKSLKVPWTERLKSSNDFNITVEAEVVPAIISSNSETERSFTIMLVRQSDGAYLIDNMVSLQ